MPSQTCARCHFWIQRYIPNHGAKEFVLPVSSEDREQAMKRDFSWVLDSSALACSRKVWDEGFEFDKSKRYEELVQRNRKDFCFFLRYRPGMLLPAAETLQARQTELQDASRDRRLTMFGLWIAAVALLVSAVLGVFQLVCGQ